MRPHATRIAILVSLGLMANVHAAAADNVNGTGTVIGQISWCRVLRGPLARGDDADVVDVTPGFKWKSPQPLRVPAQGIQLSVQGTSITAQTDSGGGFTLAGVPAAQPLTVLAQVANGPQLLVSGSPLVVDPGATLDLGTIMPPGCGDGPFVLAPQTDLPGADPPPHESE